MSSPTLTALTYRAAEISPPSNVLGLTSTLNAHLPLHQSSYDASEQGVGKELLVWIRDFTPPLAFQKLALRVGSDVLT